MKLVTVSQMRELDKRTINEYGVPGYVLMDRAGKGATGHILDFVGNLHQRHIRRFVILTGRGNNGGDGYVVAGELSSRTSIEVIILATCQPDKMGEDAAKHAQRVCGKVACQVRENISSSDFRQGDIIIDALLGVGVTGKPHSPYEQWIEQVNKLSLPVIALDIPSGLNGDDGSAPGACIIADMTITMGLPKKGLFLHKALDYCGRLRLVDIGIPKTYIAKIPEKPAAYFSKDVAKYLGRVPTQFHKKNCGYISVIGGSKDYYGAPFLAATAAMRTGAGLTRVIIPDSITTFPNFPAALIINRLSTNEEGYLCPASLDQIWKLMTKNNALVIGPGIGRHPDTAVFLGRLLKQVEIPVVIDADALYLIAQYPDKCFVCKNHILTPHPGEMERLLQTFCPESKQKNRIEQAATLSQKISAIIVLKGNKSIIASPDGRVLINSSGCPALATAGSGDCLTGIIAALAATTSNVFEATAVAVFIHGLVGELAPFGTRGLIADDLPDYIPQAIKNISPLG